MPRASGYRSFVGGRRRLVSPEREEPGHVGDLAHRGLDSLDDCRGVRHIGKEADLHAVAGDEAAHEAVGLHGQTPQRLHECVVGFLVPRAGGLVDPGDGRVETELDLLGVTHDVLRSSPEPLWLQRVIRSCTGF